MKPLLIIPGITAGAGERGDVEMIFQVGQE